MNKTRTFLLKSIIVAVTLYILLVGTTIFPSIKNVGSTEINDWVMMVENTTALPGATNHVILINGTWAQEITQYNVKLYFDPTIIETADCSLNGTVAEFEVTPGEFQYWQFSHQLVGYNGFYVGIYASAMRDNESLTVPAGSGTLLKLLVNIKDNASLGVTHLNLYVAVNGCFFLTTTNQFYYPEVKNGSVTINYSNSPPNEPMHPNPPNQAINVPFDGILSWTGGDPDQGDTVTYDIYLGTDTTPSKVASHHSAPTYIPGALSYNTTYYWQIVSWDNHDVSTSGPLWTFTTEHYIPPVEDQLTITVQPAVIERQHFLVTITANGVPVENTQVTFLDSIYYTNIDGVVYLIAPTVEQDTSYRITASKTGYHSHSNEIIVLNQEEKQTIGWIQGLVAELSDTTTTPLKDATVCIILSIQDNVTTSKCTLTDENGSYIIPAPTGTYIIKAGKLGYITSTAKNITVQTNETTVVNFTLEQGVEPKPDLFPIFIEENREAINQAITKGTVGGEIIIQPTSKTQYQSLILSYNDVRINPTEIKNDRISLVINGDENSTGKTIVVTLGKFDGVTGFTVNYDGVPIAMADDIADVLNPNNDGLHAEYIITIGENGTQILMSIPHFSAHTITITAAKIIETIGGLTALALYIVVVMILGIVYLIPFFLVRKSK